MPSALVKRRPFASFFPVSFLLIKSSLSFMFKQLSRLGGRAAFWLDNSGLLIKVLIKVRS
jgi:hypothetical protein